MTEHKRDALYYLAVRPLSERSEDVAPLVADISERVGIERATLAQKLVGTALQIVKTAKERNELDDLAKEFCREKIKAAVVSRDDIRPGTRARRASSIELAQNSVRLISASTDEAMEIDNTANVLLVLGSLDPEGFLRKRLVRSAMGNDALMSPDELVDFICANAPVLDVYKSGSPVPTRIDGAKFNYASLGELNKGSAAINLKTIITKISGAAKSSLFDVGFGQSVLPFVTIEREQTREARIGEFDAYSRFISLAAVQGIFKPADGAKGAPLGALGVAGLLWGGPLMPIPAPIGKSEGAPKAQATHAQALLPHASPDAFVRKSGIHFRTSIFGVDNLRALGPRVIVAPLVAVLVASVATASYLERSEPIPFAALALGLLLFTHSFVLIKRKRALENCPTAKIGTMPMGEVEVYGRARQKFALKAPYSLTDCVYYSYKVYESIDSSEGVRRNLKEWGSSERVPFYLEDETGTVTVTPESAIVHAGRTDTISGDAIGGIFGAMRAGGGGGKVIIETVIPIGSLLFVTGFADRTRDSAHERKKSLIDKLRHLKSDPAHVKRYDADNDGKLSAEEWEAAKRDAEEAIMAASTTQNEADRVAIGEHPTGGLFYISDKKEEHVIRSIAWRIPFVLTLGIAVTTIGSLMVLQLLSGKGIFSNIFKLL